MGAANSSSRDNGRVPSSISVALCTYNGAEFIGEQIRSILDQTVLPNEIVLSDDAPGDGTAAAALEAFATFERDHPGMVRFVLLENARPLGVADNFAQALAATEGDLVALCDQDDSWHPRKLATLSAMFEERPELLLVHSDARLVSWDGSDLGVGLLDSLEVGAAERAAIHGGRAIDAFLRRNLVTGATAMVSRALIDRALPIANGWIHDEWLAIVAAGTGALDLSEERLIDYRQHDSNQIGAEKLGLVQKARKLREPRGERNTNLFIRAASLVERLEEFGDLVPSTVMAKARAKLGHEQFRMSLPPSRLRRLLPILRHGCARYTLFGRGRADQLRDFLQPA